MASSGSLRQQSEARTAAATGREWVRVRRSSIEGRGLFARRLIPEGTRIIEYVGEKITKAEGLRREEERVGRQRRGRDDRVYIFDLNKRYDLDGDLPHNIARLINHSCAPNCQAENIRGRIWIVALRDIQPGEELSFDYGYPYSEWRLHPCHCGKPECIGYIVNKGQRWRVRAILREEQRRAARASRRSSAAVSPSPQSVNGTHAAATPLMPAP